MAEADLKSLPTPIENDLVNHNIVVFRNGEGALQVTMATSLIILTSSAIHSLFKRVFLVKLDSVFQEILISQHIYLVHDS